VDIRMVSVGVIDASASLRSSLIVETLYVWFVFAVTAIGLSFQSRV
jgi:hypothetical protein